MGKKKSDTMTVTLPDGRKMQVPRGLTGDKLASYVQNQLQAEELERQRASAEKESQVLKMQEQEGLLINMKRQMEEQAEVINQLKKQNEELRLASPEAAAGAMALMNATAQAQQLRTDLMKDMGHISEWRQQYNEDVSTVASEIRMRNRTLDQEVLQNRLRARLAMDDIREQQGMERKHPELLEQQQENDV